MSENPNFTVGDVTYPYNWEIIPIGELLIQKALISHLDGNHGNLYPRPDDFTTQGVPYLSANCIENGKVNFSKVKFLTKEKASQLKKGIAINGDVLFAHNATVGPVAILETFEPYVILGTSLTYFRCDVNKLHNRFLKFTLEADFFKQQYEQIMVQSTRNQIPITTQRELFIPFPPLPEQRAIAAILSTWDEAITITERLIVALRQRKQALMQMLLTGEVRFPGFERAWEDREFSEILDLQIGGTPSRNVPAYWDNEKTTQNRWLSIADLKSKSIRETAEHLSDLGVQHSNVKPLPAGTVVMSFKLTIGRAGILMYPSYTNEAICALIPKNNAELLNRYLYHSLSVVDFSAELDQAVKGQTLNKAKLARLHVTIPSRSEQEQITNFLDLADQELETASEFLKKLRAEKRGLMQQLLTGAIRVQVEE